MATARRRTARKPKEPARVIIDGLPFDPASKDLPPGLRRFGAQLDKARVALATKVAHDAKGPDALLGHVLYRAGLRTPLFMLEGLSRIARDTSEDEETFRAVLRDVKIAEDVLGLVDFWWVLHGKGQEWELPEEFLQMARDRHQAASGRLVGWLEARAWIDHRYLPEEGEVQLRVHRIGRELQDVRWPSARKERKRLLAFFRECVEATERAAQSLDLNDLEHGVHELRRRLRWISIYANALDGAVQLDKSAKPPKNWSRYLTPAVVENPFNDLPRGDGTGADPILFPAPLFYALSWLIAELGTLKDRAQWTESVAQGLEALGVAGGGKPRRWLGEVALDAKEAGKSAGALSRQALIEDKVLQRLAAALEAQS